MTKNISQARKNMVDSQIHPAGVTNSLILQAFESIPREQFIPESMRGIAYYDNEICVDSKYFLLAPSVHARIIQAAKPTMDDVVLDIGAGAGYSSSILSSIVTTIIAIGNDKRKIDRAMRIWNNIDICNVAIIESDLTKGSPEHAPFSLIFINGAVDHVPQNILEQLAPEGRLVTIVKKYGQSIGRATIFQKSLKGNVSSKIIFDTPASYLKGFEPTQSFTF